MPTTKVQKLDGFWVDEERGVTIHMDFIADGILMIDTWKPEPDKTEGWGDCIASVKIDLRTGQIVEGFNTRTDLADDRLVAIDCVEEMTL